MRSAIGRLWEWILGHAFVVGLATVGVAIVAAVTWAAIDVTRPPDFAEYGHQPYLEAQRRLHREEARAQLAMLASALTVDRPAEGLAARAERLRDDLAWAFDASVPLEHPWPDIEAEFERLVDQLRRDDPDAGETLARVRALVAGSGGAP